MSARAWKRRRTKAVRTWYVNGARYSDVWVENRSGRWTLMSREARPPVAPIWFSRIPGVTPAPSR